MTVQEACAYIRWYGTSDNCLRADKAKFNEAVAVAHAAPTIMTIRKGPHGPMAIIAVVGQEVAYRDHVDDVGWGCHFVRWSIGGLFQSVAQTVLGKGSPSQYISGFGAGGVLVLTPAYAEHLGIQAKPGRLDPSDVRAAFGSNVTRV